MVDFLSKAQRSARMARIAAEIGRGHAVSFVEITRSQSDAA